MDKPALFLGYPDHMVFSEFRRRFDVLAPHLTKKHGRNYIVVDERRVGLRSLTGPPSFCPDPSEQLPLIPSRAQLPLAQAPGFGHLGSEQGPVATKLCRSGEGRLGREL